MGNKQKISIPKITLEWSEWFPFEKLRDDAKINGIKIPNKKSGVYEVKYQSTDERLTIGKASNLRFRIRQALVKGKSPHSSGDKIRLKENVSKIVIRWAITERPSAAEEELHKNYKKTWGCLPKYTSNT